VYRLARPTDCLLFAKRTQPCGHAGSASPDGGRRARVPAHRRSQSPGNPRHRTMKKTVHPFETSDSTGNTELPQRCPRRTCPADARQPPAPAMMTFTRLSETPGTHAVDPASHAGTIGFRGQRQLASVAAVCAASPNPTDCP